MKEKKNGAKIQTTTPNNTRKVEETISSEAKDHLLTQEINQEAFF